MSIAVVLEFPDAYDPGVVDTTVTAVVEAGVEGTAGAAGPNSVSDTTALGPLTDASADALFLLAANLAGDAARKITLGATGRSLLGAASAAAARALLGLATVAATGAYSDLTGTPTPYSLPTASGSVLGGVKVGTGLSIDGSGVLSASGAVSSVFGRTGTVVAGSGDYTAAQVTNAASLIAANVFSATQRIDVARDTDAIRFRDTTTGLDAYIKVATPIGGGPDLIIGGANWLRIGVGVSVLRFEAASLMFLGNFFPSLAGGSTFGCAAAQEIVLKTDVFNVELFKGGLNTPNTTIRPYSAANSVRIQGFASQTASLLELWGVSSTSTNRVQAAVATDWATGTDASRAGRLTLGAYYTTTLQEAVRIDGDTGGVRLGFYAATAVAKQTVTGSRGSNAALADLLTKLAALGLITDSSS